MNHAIEQLVDKVKTRCNSDSPVSLSCMIGCTSVFSSQCSLDAQLGNEGNRACNQPGVSNSGTT